MLGRYCNSSSRKNPRLPIVAIREASHPLAHVPDKMLAPAPVDTAKVFGVAGRSVVPSPNITAQVPEYKAAPLADVPV